MTDARFCRGCLSLLPSRRWVWCSMRCQNFTQNHPRDFLRIFRWCKSCGAEIDHLAPDRRFCDRECLVRHSNQRLLAKRQQERLVLRGRRVCARCGADISLRRANIKYCTSLCGEIARGQRLPEPLQRRLCALPECGQEFQPNKSMQRCCSEKHGKLLYNRESRADGRQKPPPWSDERRDRYHRRRAQKKQTSSGEPVLLSEIAERDEWRCHLCGVDVDPELSWPDPMSPSLDHVVPLSLGGTHTPENVRLAHLRCNTAKGNRSGEEQVLLSG